MRRKPPEGGLLILALLIRNAAAGLAGRLAGGLALAATAILGAQITGLDGLDMLHDFTFYSKVPSSLPYHNWIELSIIQFILFILYCSNHSRISSIRSTAIW